MWPDHLSQDRASPSKLPILLMSLHVLVLVIVTSLQNRGMYIVPQIWSQLLQISSDQICVFFMFANISREWVRSHNFPELIPFFVSKLDVACLSLLIIPSKNHGKNSKMELSAIYTFSLICTLFKMFKSIPKKAATGNRTSSFDLQCE